MGFLSHRSVLSLCVAVGRGQGVQLSVLLCPKSFCLPANLLAS